MELKNYIYVSENKIDIFYPQVRDMLSDAKATVGINIGFFKAEYQKEMKESDKIVKLNKIINYLESTTSVGTIGSPSQFFRGEATVKILLNRNRVFMFGTSDDGVSLGLCCSLKNMIGSDFENIEEDRDRYHSSASFAYFENSFQNSSTLGFAWALNNVWKKEISFANSQFDFNKEREAALTKFKLTEEQVRIINEKPFFNKILEKYATRNEGLKIRPMDFQRPVRYFINLIIGKELAAAKYEAIVTRRRALVLKNEIHKLEKGNQELLDFVKRTKDTITARSHRISFLAVTMLNGTSNGSKVVLGSPLYVCESNQSHN